MQRQWWGSYQTWATCIALTACAVLLTGCPTPVDPGPGQQLDADDDGVFDADDLCPNTPAGTTVDEDGCAASQRDTDDDGVTDQDDDCPGTSAGATVDENGCADSQLDSDDDGVADDIDECPDTPAGETVDAVGCTVGNSTEDDDGDGVSNANDDCPNTPAGATVDANGCTDDQLDIDGDGVPNDQDDCPGTPDGAIVDAAGCAPSQLDSDGDGTPDNRDQCPGTPTGTPVGADGCPAGGGNTAVCGNGALEAGEECEPPGTATCDANCNRIEPAEELNADNCANAVTLAGEGTFVFDNTNATQDGPAHTGCVSFGEDQLDHDVWGQWTAPCTGTVFVRTCGLTAVDTKLAVYAGTTCPPTDAGLLTCNDDACSSQAVQSLVTFEATTGQSYLIRLGTFPGEPGGVGGISITCGLSVCPGEGECFAANGSPGCNDESCCERTCEVDPFCCENTWDEVCAEEAQGLCTGSFDTCGGRSGSCTDPAGNGTPGCSDTDCCNAVCAEDPFCCLQEWDDVCASLEAAICRTTCGTPEAGACDAVHANAGCSDDACCAEVCVRDPVCCQAEWDQTCVDLANQHCE